MVKDYQQTKEDEITVTALRDYVSRLELQAQDKEIEIDDLKTRLDVFSIN